MSSSPLQWRGSAAPMCFAPMLASAQCRVEAARSLLLSLGLPWSSDERREMDCVGSDARQTEQRATRGRQKRERHETDTRYTELRQGQRSAPYEAPKAGGAWLPRGTVPNPQVSRGGQPLAPKGAGEATPNP